MSKTHKKKRERKEKRKERNRAQRRERAAEYGVKRGEVGRVWTGLGQKDTKGPRWGRGERERELQAGNGKKQTVSEGL